MVRRSLDTVAVEPPHNRQLAGATRSHSGMRLQTKTLIIGAGPFGLALSAYARANGIDHAVVGRPMDFWKQQMPQGMLLRSRCDWHLDPFDLHTIEHYLETQDLRPEDVEPLSLKFYLDYCDWFTKQKGIEI